MVGVNGTSRLEGYTARTKVHVYNNGLLNNEETWRTHILADFYVSIHFDTCI